MRWHSIILSAVLITTNVAVIAIRILPPTICLKENTNVDKHRSIKIAACDFKEFVRDSDIFVDKSSLIANLVTINSSLVSLTYPEKWGKSINLNMLKTFLEMEVDSEAKAMPPKMTWSYRFFKNGEITYENGTCTKLTHPPMISRNEQVMRLYLARYPVIYLNLSIFDPISQDFQGFFKPFQKRIADVFEAHGYMVEVFRDQLDNCESTGCDRHEVKNHLTKFKSYKAAGVNSPEDMVSSLMFLSMILHSHFNQRVYVLIDDYDAIIRKSFLEPSSLIDSEAQKIREFYEQFITYTFLMNANVEMGIVTGIFHLDKFGGRLNYNLLNKNAPPFYGFTANEVKQLLTQLSIDGKLIKEALEYYYHYRVGDFPEVVIYDPWPIINFVNNRKLEHSRSSMGASEISSFMVRCKALGKQLDNLILDGSEFTEVHLLNLTLREKDLLSLKNVINGTQYPSDDEDIANIVLAYFYAKGYFTLHIPTVFGSRMTGVKIDFANREIKNDVSDRYSSTLEKDVESGYSRKVADVLRDVVKYQGYYEFSMSSRYLYDSYKVCCQKISSDRNFIKLEDFHSLHFWAMKFMKVFGYNVNFNALYHDGDHLLRPYMVLENTNHRAIVEYGCSYDPNHNSWFDSDACLGIAKDALNRAKQFNIIFKGKPSRNTSFVGISVCIPRHRALTSVNIIVDANPNIIK